MKDRLIRTGVVGAAVAALCCFTPVLIVLLTALGQAGAVGWLDYVVMPALLFFLGLTGDALWRRRKSG